MLIVKLNDGFDFPLLRTAYVTDQCYKSGIGKQFLPERYFRASLSESLSMEGQTGFIEYSKIATEVHLQAKQTRKWHTALRCRLCKGKEGRKEEYWKAPNTITG